MNNNSQSFYIRAAINEEGPKELLVQPDEDGYDVYIKEDFLCRIELEVDKKDTSEQYFNDLGNDLDSGDDVRWKLTKGDLTQGVANGIAEAIKRGR